MMWRLSATGVERRAETGSRPRRISMPRGGSYWGSRGSHFSGRDNGRPCRQRAAETESWGRSCGDACCGAVRWRVLLALKRRLDFDMSDVQQEHALGVERHVPSLAALRIELCPGYMSETRFWMIYFVLIHPRLSKEDTLLLSTPPILEARALLSQELQRSMTESSNFQRGLGTAEGTSPRIPQELGNEHLLPITNNHEKEEVIESVSPAMTTSVTSNNAEGDHQLSSMRETPSQAIPTEEISVKNNDVVTMPSNQSDLKHDDEDQEVEDWLQEESDGHEAPTSNAKHLGNEEDVSFSDLEDDDDDDAIQ